jgi:cysteine desulfurase
MDLDANATTALLSEVFEAMLPWLRDGHGNPSASYRAAREARRAIDSAREQVAALIGAEPDEIVFTGGGTESVNTALHSLDLVCGSGAAVTSAIEHSAVLRTLDRQSRETRRSDVDGGGRIVLDDIGRMLDGAAFVSVMWANNETGVIQPLVEITAMAKERGLPVHSDAIQAVGKIPVDVRAAHVDLLSLSAHKFHGPKGTGALFVRRGLRFEPLLHGGGQESGRRSGTENTAGIVGMGAAARIAMERPATVAISGMRDAFEAKVLAEIHGVVRNGDAAHRLPSTSHLSFADCDAAGLLILMDEAGVACSAGSACMTGKQQPSHVQLAMGIPESRARSSLRFGFSRLNTMDDALGAASALAKAVAKLREVQSPGVGPVVIHTR